MSLIPEAVWPALVAATFAVAGYQLLGWIWSLVRRDASVVDVLWGPGFVLVAAAGALQGNGARPRQALVLSLVTIWAVRLSSHILRRNLAGGEDYRYRAMRERHGERFPWISLVTVFALQGGLMLVIGQPLLAAMAIAGPTRLGGWDFAGAAVFTVGFLFEAIGDAQLRRFKETPNRAGAVMDRGLWRYTRHPNYFGDALLWWGLFLVACAVPGGIWSFSGPLVMTFFLLKVSGVALLEKGLQKSKPAYADYVRRTSAFLPWFPRR